MKILPNGIAVIEGDSHISMWVEQSGRLDHDTYALPIILDHIPEGGIVVDGGAFIVLEEGDQVKCTPEASSAFTVVLTFELIGNQRA